MQATIQQINQQILRAFEQEARTDKFKRHVKDVFTIENIPPNPQKLEHLENTVRQYIGHVPDLLNAIYQAAHQKNIAAQVGPFINEIGQYFFSEDDFIPDSLGLIGLLDDAFLTYEMIIKINGLCQKEYGYRLVQADLSKANKSIELFIGKDIAHKIRAYAEQRLQSASSQISWKTLAKVALGGLAVYSVISALNGGNSYSSSSWGDSFESQTNQFFAGDW